MLKRETVVSWAEVVLSARPPCTPPAQGCGEVTIPGRVQNSEDVALRVTVSGHGAAGLGLDFSNLSDSVVLHPIP